MSNIDLRTNFPRGPRATLDGIKILPRAIDKARAQLAGTLGDYVYFNCGINRMLFGTLEVTDDEFLEHVRRPSDAGADDEEIDRQVVSWIRNDLRVPPERLAAMNALIETVEPQSAEEKQWLHDSVVAIDPTRGNITRFADLLDLEEGRAVA